MRHINVGDWRRATRGDVDAMINVIKLFVIDSRGVYLSPDKAERKIESLNFGELTDILNQLALQSEEVAAPKALGSE